MPLPPVHWETFFPCRRGGTPARPSPWAVTPAGRDDSARRTLQGFALRGDLLCPRRQRRQNAAGGGLRWAPPPIVAPPPDPRNLRGPNSGGRWGTVRRGWDNDCPRIRAAAAAGPKSRRPGQRDQKGAPDRSRSNLCGGNWRAGPRRRGLHIPRFAQQGKARSFHRSASPTQTRFAGLCVGGRLRRPLWTDRRPPVPHPLPRLVRTRRGGEMEQAEILHRTRAQWPGRNHTRNHILRAGNIT